jgi:hypothetical protein
MAFIRSPEWMISLRCFLFLGMSAKREAAIDNKVGTCNKGGALRSKE